VRDAQTAAPAPAPPAAAEKGEGGEEEEGRGAGAPATAPAWVRRYRVQSSLDGLDWEEVAAAAPCTGGGFAGNTDAEATCTAKVAGAGVLARYVRVCPTEWEGRIALRVELAGADPDPDAPPPAAAGGATEHPAGKAEAAGAAAAAAAAAKAKAEGGRRPRLRSVELAPFAAERLAAQAGRSEALLARLAETLKALLKGAEAQWRRLMQGQAGANVSSEDRIEELAKGNVRLRTELQELQQSTDNRSMQVCYSAVRVSLNRSVQV
jgi:hypothetical protein